MLVRSVKRYPSFESVGNYAKVFFGPNKPLILKSLNALEERLDEKHFSAPTVNISSTFAWWIK